MVLENTVYRPGEERRFEDHLFFLAQNGRILATRSALPTPCVGENFFDAFPMKDSEKAELYRLLDGFCNSCAFFRAGARTVLFLTAFYAETGYFIALVPGKSLARLCERPAALEKSLPHLYCSGELQKRLTPPTQIQYQALRDYLSAYARTLYFELDRRFPSVNSLWVALTLRAEQIAELTGCCIDADFTGIGVKLPESLLPERGIGLLYLLCLTARRAAKDQKLSFSAEDFGSNMPIGIAELELLDPDDPLPELADLPLTAAMYGFLLDLQKANGRLTVTFGLCNRDLARQGLKHPEIYPARDPELLPRPFPRDENGNKA